MRSEEGKRAGDAGLVILAKKGEAGAFEKLYDRHAEGVARALSSYAGPDREAVNDLTQEVFCRVIASLSSYRPLRPFAHWLYTITLNVGRNYVRARSREIPVDPGDLEGTASGGRPPGDLSREALAVRLVRFASHLPEHMREVVSLRIGGGLPYGEIGEMLGIPEGTARSRMHYAMKALREKAERKERTDRRDRR